MRNIFNIILMATSLTSSVYAQTTTSTSDLKKAFYEYVDQIQEPIKKTRQAMSKIRTDCAVSLDQRLVFEDCKKSANQIKAAGDEIIKLAKISFESYNKILSIEAKNEVEASYKKQILKEIRDSNRAWAERPTANPGDRVSSTLYLMKLGASVNLIFTLLMTNDITKDENPLPKVVKVPATAVAGVLGFSLSNIAAVPIYASGLTFGVLADSVSYTTIAMGDNTFGLVYVHPGKEIEQYRISAKDN